MVLRESAGFSDSPCRARQCGIWSSVVRSNAAARAFSFSFYSATIFRASSGSLARAVADGESTAERDAEQSVLTHAARVVGVVSPKTGIHQNPQHTQISPHSADLCRHLPDGIAPNGSDL